MSKDKKLSQLNNSKLEFTVEAIDRMHKTPLTVQSFQRTARQYFKTTRLKNLIFLHYSVTGQSCTINFDTDDFGYMKMKVSTMGCEVQFIKPATVKDLMIKIYNYGR